jgi:hypothetical protein
LSEIRIIVKLSPPTAAAEADTARARRKRSTGVVRDYLLLLAAAILLVSPIIWGGFPAGSNDGATHVGWQYFYAREVWDGNLLPRWLPALNEGLGSPVFFIYPPLAHYVAALLEPFSHSVAWVHHRLGIATMLSFFLSGIGCTVWLRQLGGHRTGALLGALVYMMMPYHLFLDAYYRSAYAELWAFSWAPFALAGIHLLGDRPRVGIVMYTLSVAALLLSHAPSCIVLLPVYAVYALLVAVTGKRTDLLVRTALGTGVAILIAAVYLAPALTQQVYTRANTMYDGFFQFHNWFLSLPIETYKRGIVANVVLQTAATLLFGWYAFRNGAHRAAWRRLFWGAMGGTAFVFFMQLPLSARIWDLIPFAQKIQFPWRLLTAQCLFFPLLVGLHYQTGFAARLPAWLAWGIAAACFAVNAGMYAFNRPQYDMVTPMHSMNVGEYDLGNSAATAWLFPGNAQVVATAGNAAVRVLHWKSRDLAFDIDTPDGADLAIRQFVYTGWTCEDDAGQPCRLLSSTWSGDVLGMRVGAGKHRIYLVMPALPAERWGAYASIAGLLLLAVLAAASSESPGHGPGRRAP